MIKRLLQFLIGAYRVWQPMPFGVCKFYPSCSNYAYEALEKLGPIKGTIRAIRRILKCNPFSLGGVDMP